MRRTFFCCMLLCLTLLFSACGVSQTDYDALVEENSSLQEQVESLEALTRNLGKQIKELEAEAAIASGEATTETTTETTTEATTKATTKTDFANEPTNIEIVAYAQTVIKDFYPDCKFPFASTREFNVVKTGLRYKIEGTFKENKNASYEDFWMIIEFLDNKFEIYDLISLQVGKTMVYKNN